VTHVRFFVEQRLTIKARRGGIGEGWHQYSTSRQLVTKEMPGPAAGVGGWQSEMMLDLSQIRYDAPGPFKYKRGV